MKALDTSPLIPIGRRIRRLREANDLTTAELSKRLQVSAFYLERIERGLYRCSVRVAEGCADIFELKGEGRRAFLASRLVEVDLELIELPAPRASGTRRLPMARVTCRPCTHDGSMAPGGSEDGRERENDCVHYDACLDKLLATDPNVRRCHCPPGCLHKAVAPEVERAGVGSWAGLTFPSGFPGKGRPGRAA